MKLVGYTYEADVHCRRCARNRFGARLDYPNTTDRERNALGVIHDVDEGAEDETCGECGDELI